MDVLTRILSTTGKPIKHRPANLKNRKAIQMEMAEHPERFLVAPNIMIDTQAVKGKKMFGDVNSRWAKTLINEAIKGGATTIQMGTRFILPRTKTGQPRQLLSSNPKVYALTTTKRGGVEFRTRKPPVKKTKKIEHGGFVSKKLEVADLQRMAGMPGSVSAPTATIEASAALLETSSEWQPGTHKLGTSESRYENMMGGIWKWSPLFKDPTKAAFWTIIGANGNVKADWFSIMDGWGIFEQTMLTEIWGILGSPDDDEVEYHHFMKRWGKSAQVHLVLIPKVTMEQTKKKYAHRLQDSGDGRCVVNALMGQVKPRTLKDVENWIEKNGHPDIDPLIDFLREKRNINVNLYNQAGYPISIGKSVNLYLTRKDHVEKESKILKPWELFKNGNVKIIDNIWDEFKICKERKMWTGSPRDVKVFWTDNCVYTPGEYRKWSITTPAQDTYQEFLELNKLEKLTDENPDLFRFVSHSCHYLASENYEDCENAIGYDVNKMYFPALKNADVPFTSKMRFGECYHLPIDDVLSHCGCTQIWDIKYKIDVLASDKFINSVLYNGAIYPNNFLRTIRKLGFIFTAGVTAYVPCVAAVKKLEIKNDWLKTKHYQSLVGRLDFKSTRRGALWWSVAEDEDELADIQARNKEQIEVTDDLTWGFLPPHYKEGHSNYCHVASQVLGEAMVLMVNHLVEFRADDLMAIKTDCIFLKSDVPVPPKSMGMNPGKLKFEKKVNLDFWKTNGFLINPTLKYTDPLLANKSGVCDTDGSNWIFETQGAITKWEIESQSGHVICIGYAGSGKSYFYENRKDTLIACPTRALADELKCSTTTHHTAFHLNVPKDDGTMVEAGWCKRDGKKVPQVPLNGYTYVVFDEAHQFGGDWNKIVQMCDDAHACLHVILDVENSIPRQLPPVNVKFRMDKMERALRRQWYANDLREWEDKNLPNWWKNSHHKAPPPSYRILGLDDIRRQQGKLKDFIRKVYTCRTNDKIKEMILSEYSDMIIGVNQKPRDVAASVASVFNPDKDLVIVPYKKNIELLNEFGVDASTCHSMIGRTHRGGKIFVSLNYFETGMLYTSIGRVSGHELYSLCFFSL
tara:strand:- start:251 stop:3499 length:3249 start_codon:yes stop_codon:yes gene_type:complete